VTLPTAASPSALVDPSQIEQVLVNLALNGRDAMKSGGTLTIATGNAEIDVETAAERGVEPGSFVVLSVSDTGEGMNAETKERAFEPFFTTRPHGEGTGLGLASVYGTVTQSGGFIELTSELGRGTTIEIHFPCVEGAGASETGAAVDPKAERATIALVAEDEAIVRDLAANVLRRAGFDVRAAPNGEEALELYHQIGETIDVLVTDMVMPGMGGRELAERIRLANPMLPIVFMSGYTEEAPPTGIGPGTGARFLQKPFFARDLVAAVREVADEAAVARVLGTVADGGTSTGPTQAPAPPAGEAAAVPSPLTRREREILALVADGMTNEKVGAALAISPETVQSHMRNTMAKLEADTRTEAVATALRRSLIS